MNAYIEIESLRSLISQRNDARYDECLRMLKRNLNLNFSFSRAEAMADPAIQSWLIGLTSGIALKSGVIAKKPNWDCNYPNPEEEFSLDEINNIDQLCAVYLLDDEKPQNLSKAMFIGNLGHELDTLMKLFVVPEEASFEYKFSVSRMTSWNEMKPYVTPCTDLLIVDRYILSRASLLERNLYRLIKIFVSQTKSLQINIVIVVEFGSIDSVSLEDISERIKAFVEDIVGEEPFVTFVLCKKQFQKALYHDRCILTNYRYVDSGDSLNYFTERGELKTGGFKLSISSLANPSDYVQRIIDKEVLFRIRNEVKGAVNIIGDKKSNFLTFR